MSHRQPHGIVVAPVTPMNADLSVDHGGLRALVDHLVTSGVHGLTPCAITAETETLTLTEQRDVLRTVVETVAGRVPVYCGVGRPSILEVRALSSYVDEIGGDGLFVITPYASAHVLDEVLDHFREVAAGTRLPVMIYNTPGYAGVNITPKAAATLSEIPNIVATKEGLQDQLHDTVRAVGERMAVLTGRDSYLLSSMVVGARGVVSFAANVAPELLVELYDTVQAGRFEAARALHERVASLVEVLVSRSYPVMIKEAMAVRGLPAGPARRVAGGASAAERQAIREAVAHATRTSGALA